MLEEAPRAPASAAPSRTLAGAAALGALATRRSTPRGAARRAPRRQPTTPLADVAYTLQTGRKPFRLREVLVCEERADAIARLRLPRPRARASARELVFVCPASGEHHHDLDALLYDVQPVFRARVDHCRSWLRD